MYLSRLFGSQKDTPAIVVLNSRGNLIADYLEKNHIEDVKMICMDLTSANIEALKKGRIEFPDRTGTRISGILCHENIA